MLSPTVLLHKLLQGYLETKNQKFNRGNAILSFESREICLSKVIIRGTTLSTSTCEGSKLHSTSEKGVISCPNYGLQPRTLHSIFDGSLPQLYLWQTNEANPLFPPRAGSMP